MFPVRAAGTMFKHEQQPAVVARHQRKAKKATALEQAYKVVDLRDQLTCRCTGAYLRPGVLDARARLEHHHLAGRRVESTWREDPKRIICVSALVHQLLHSGLLQVEGVNASAAKNRLRFFWREDVPQDQRIVRIYSRRRSAQ